MAILLGISPKKHLKYLQIHLLIPDQFTNIGLFYLDFEVVEHLILSKEFSFDLLANG
jgi:hypothetical protein